jgi:hypothetical protein
MTFQVVSREFLAIGFGFRNISEVRLPDQFELPRSHLFWKRKLLSMADKFRALAGASLFPKKSVRIKFYLLYFVGA